MTASDDELARRIRDAWPAGDDGGPSFEQSWQSAGRRRAASVRRHRGFAVVAVLAAAVIVGLNVRPRPPEERVELAGLLDSTSWSAPSDVLLPDREFDIYQELPDLLESSEPAGGTLL